MEQLSLDGTAVALGRQAPRQDAVLKLLAQHPEGCSADEIGAAIHASSGKHDAESTCAYCAIDARGPLLSLIKKRLVTRTGNGQFTLRNQDAPGGPGNEIPF